VRTAIEAGARVVPVPGASAVLSALVGSGLPTDSFFFAGFPPRKTGARRLLFSRLGQLGATLVFYESPHRVGGTLAELVAVLGPSRPACLARELTKTHEEFVRGSLGELAAFSFYPSKVLGALGDGGALTTSDAELDARVRQLRYMGQRGTKHEHLVLGYQERLDELQAAFLRVKLRGLEGQIEGRRRVAARYGDWLAGTPVEPPAHDPFGRHAYYMYTVLAPERDALRVHLDERRIRTQLIYPKLVPDQGAYSTNAWRADDDLDVARSLVPRLLCLPMFAELSDEEVDRVGRAIRDFYGAS